VCLLAFLITGISCRRATEPEPGPMDAASLSVQPTPFGHWVLVDRATQDLLYPTLSAFAAPADDLLALLPARVLGAPATGLQSGVHEGDDAASLGAMARYLTPEGPVLLFLEDTAWEPTRLDPVLAAWARGREGSLPDGRRLCTSLPGEVDGPTTSTWPSISGPGRLVLHARTERGAPAALAQEALLAVDSAAVAGLEARTGTRTGPFPDSPLLPDALRGRLTAPESLRDALPVLPGQAPVAEGWGHRREAQGTVSAVATRVWILPSGPLVATLSDVGSAEHPVLLGAGAGPSSADEVRAELERGPVSRCSGGYASCKWAAISNGRLVRSVTGPDQPAGAITSLTEAFPDPAALTPPP
jgi:hypothetical protein